MANIVKATVSDRAITLGTDHDPLIAGNVGHDFCKATFDSEWTGLSIRATFACGKQAVTVDYDTTATNGVEIPHECLVPGSLRVGFVGVDSTGKEILRTAHMRNGVPVKAAGQDMGAEPTEKTMDVVTKAQKALSDLSTGITAKQDKLIAGENITIGSDGKTISAAGGASTWDEITGKPTNVSYFTNDAGYAKTGSSNTFNGVQTFNDSINFHAGQGGVEFVCADVSFDVEELDLSLCESVRVPYPSANYNAATKSYVDTAVGKKYTKPSYGIPASDIADGVIPVVDVTKAYVDTELAKKRNISNSYDKTTVDAKLADKITNPGGGTEGQVLTKTAEGEEWADASGGVSLPLSVVNGKVCITFEGDDLQ